jgi:WNK lysine deficient protein kinase
LLNTYSPKKIVRVSQQQQQEQHKLTQTHTHTATIKPQFAKRLGSGSYKTVYLAIDNETGSEVAWNTISLRGKNVEERERIVQETHILRTVRHDNIIQFFDVWQNVDHEQLCFITQRASSTLTQYLSRMTEARPKLLRKWCRQLLRALVYLHSFTPPIIHRDLKCDNIFIDGTSGDIRIGDFGLSTNETNYSEIMLGTPGWMAPEMFDPDVDYTPTVDVFAFGMCVLEILTHEYPYAECATLAEVIRVSAAGVAPCGLEKIRDAQYRALVERCLLPIDERQAAAAVLNDALFDEARYTDETHPLYVPPTDPRRTKRESMIAPVLI